MSLLHIGGSSGTSVVEAEGVDFDGVADYLSRSTDLVGNVDSKTFTFSCWVYDVRFLGNQTYLYQSYAVAGTGERFSILLYDTGKIEIIASNAAGTNILFAYTGNNVVPRNGYYNVLFSIDMSNTTKRSLYINDVNVAVTWNTYINDTVDTTVFGHVIANRSSGVSLHKGRLSNLFLDYTYRDLRIEANRRLFITADGKPTPTATLKALNPILYLPMKDAATAHINEGTGGNFTANGTFATSNRGANQDNCVASYFDGSADYLSRTSLTGVADGKQLIASFIINNKDFISSSTQIFSISASSIYGLKIQIGSNGRISVQLYNSSGTRFAYVDSQLDMSIKSTHHVCLSFDTSNQNSIRMLYDGKEVAVTWYAYSNDTINLTKTFYAVCEGYSGANLKFYGNIGELYFDTKYIDLATNNPFWDSVANKPKPVRQVIAETGVVPLIAMPLDASNAGKNYGTGGDFTANSAPYVGARGASEFWARSVSFPAVSGSNLTNTTPITGTTASIVIAYKSNIAANRNILGFYDTGYIAVHKNSYQAEVNLDGAFIMSFTPAATDTLWNYLFICGDGYDNTKNKVYDRTGALPLITNISQNKGFSFLNGCFVGGDNYSLYNGSVAFTYLTTDYIDFSQEVNRLKFVDGLGYPLDLKKQIDAGVIPKPLVYLPFDDPTNLGKNLGTGGNFTVNGTVTAGADFSL